MRERIGAIIIKDKKILMVGDKRQEFLWTPGGKIEEGEDHRATLARELREELNVSLKKMTHYLQAEILNDTSGKMELSDYYFVEYEGEITPKKEIKKLHWLSKEEFINKKVGISSGSGTVLIPKLIQDGYL